MQLKDYELNEIVGGAISATFLNSVVRGLTVLLEIGRSIGTSIRRYRYGNLCSM